jgi:pyridoxal phosphate enzyme (YggS family)
VSRAEELAGRLAEVRERIAAACAAADRSADEVTLVVVTKYFPASDVRLLADLGVADVGENKHQEAEAKAEECADLGLRWHFIGGLQSNKAAAVARYAAMVHSVDRAKLVGPLDRGAAQRSEARPGPAADEPLPVLLQVSLDGPDATQRYGAEPADLAALAGRVAQAEHLDLRGLMAVAPVDEDPARAFDRLAAVRADLLAEHPGASLLSAGMSGDLEAAVAIGATHVRVGSAVLGPRPPVH